jgi:flagellar protein FlbD
MIKLKRLNGTNFVLNCELIETVEETPDTVISTINGKKFIVMETIEEIVEKVLEYKRSVLLKDRV